jgi:diguanylate cyclase
VSARPDNARAGLRSNAANAALALLLAGGMLLLLQYVSLRAEAIADARVQAQVVASSSAAAVMFRDQQAIAETLDSLSTLDAVRGVRILDLEGGVLAAYPGPAAPVGDCGVDCAQVRVPIAFQDQAVGTIDIDVGMGQVYRRLLALGGAFLVASLVGFALTMPLMARMRARVRAAEDRLDYLAHFDPVTGCRNRNAFNAYIEQVFDPAQRQALVQLDVDRFKEVNDTLGHVAGDALLRQVAQRVSGAVRAEDRVFRLGGDEFAVVLSRVASAAQARRAAARILECFAMPFELSGQHLVVTASAGVSLWPDDATAFSELAGNADAAMYEAKRGGRNRVSMYEPRLREAQVARLRMQADLRLALERGELRLHYQPQVDTRSGGLRGAEALLRWNHPEHGPVSPAAFIPVAEECGLIVDIGRWVLAEACRQAAVWRAQGHGDLRIAVNVSVRQTRDDRLTEYIDSVLADTGMPAGCLELEITENVLMEEADLAIALLARLRARGLHLAIDDFGTGYSSMAYLKRLPIDKLKIDMGFVRAIPGDGEAITTAILAMAKQLGLGVVAEGVETQAQHRFLDAAGCDQLQGYRFDPGLPPDVFAERWLRPGRAAVTAAD